MHFLCPSCREPLPASLACVCGQSFGLRDDVLVLLEQEFGRRLDQFTQAFSAVRAVENRRLLDGQAYEALPFGSAVQDDFQWRLRQYDLAVVRRLLNGRRSQRLLDVGAWNGWLSNRMADDGHLVTAIDYFVDEFDGLGAKKFYSTAWQAIQMDLTDLHVLDVSFDVIILNRCLQFFPQPAAYVALAKAKLAPGGLLIVTGMELFRDPHVKAARVADMLHVHRQRYGFELFLTPTKGYLDFDDKAQLQTQGVQVKSYRPLLPANVKAMLQPTLPYHAYGVLLNA